MNFNLSSDNAFVRAAHIATCAAFLEAVGICNPRPTLTSQYCYPFFPTKHLSVLNAPTKNRIKNNKVTKQQHE